VATVLVRQEWKKSVQAAAINILFDRRLGNSVEPMDTCFPMILEVP
jgi:hypothetical protein